MDRLLEDGLRLVDFELCLEVGDVVREAATVGTTTGVGEVEFIVIDVIADMAPTMSVLVG